jgi:hypothetical protein
MKIGFAIKRAVGRSLAACFPVRERGSVDAIIES